MTPAQLSFAAAVSTLYHTNPFLPERIDAERVALGCDFAEPSPVWSRTSTLERPNIARLRDKIEALAAEVRPQFVSSKSRPSQKDKSLYIDLILYLLYYRTWTLFDPNFKANAGELPVRHSSAYREFLAHYKHFFPTSELAPPDPPEHLFALFFQIRRAFHFIFQFIIGTSPPIAALRASIWQSIFTCDLEAYRTSLFNRLNDFPTLITGPSGTGKELVARAIALSRYIPFNPQKLAFADDPHSLFLPLNLSALAPTLIESELFGHRKGSFTGALEDRPGYLELCPPRGSVFLDEIGELDPIIQVKLLRVLQSRTYNRIGDSNSRTFPGKLLAATNRDLPSEINAGRFRHDLYYRLCADLITTPSLREQLAKAHDPRGELTSMVHFIAVKVVGAANESDPAAHALTETTVKFIQKNLGPDYPWPGNFRELEQCVRNILIRKFYQPAAPAQSPASDALAAALANSILTAEQVLALYAQIAYAQSRSYLETARRLDLDRRTIKSYVTAAKQNP